MIMLIVVIVLFQSYECRRISMADHFGEDFDSSMCDSACDYCFNKESKNPTDSDITFYAQEIMNLIAGEVSYNLLI